MSLKSVIGILMILEFVVINAIDKGYPVECNDNCLCNCDDIRYIRAPDPVCANLVFYDQCEFDCVSNLYSNLQKTICPPGTKSPGRSYPKQLNESKPTTDNCLCGCERINYFVAPQPVCATASFGDGCEFNCVEKRYLNVKQVPCESKSPCATAK